jgi:hypothetical protein
MESDGLFQEIGELVYFGVLGLRFGWRRFAGLMCPRAVCFCPCCRGFATCVVGFFPVFLFVYFGFVCVGCYCLFCSDLL